MKLSKQMIAVAAIILVVGFFCVDTFVRKGDNRSIPAGDKSIPENAPVQKTETRQGVRSKASGAQVENVVAQAEDSRNDHSAVAVAVATPPGKAQIKTTLPKAVFQGTPKEIKGAPNLEPPREGKLRDPIFVPVGCEHLLSRDCKVTSSDPDPIIGELSYITDGDKEHDPATYVEIGPGTQWVQIDLEKACEIYAACVWHFHGEPRVYRDVICQISNDPDFIDDVVTVFNNDHDNSSKLGVGTDKEYIETNEGRPFPVDAVKGRYVRCYSRGNTSNEMNHYIEIEIYGKEAN